MIINFSLKKNMAGFKKKCDRLNLSRQLGNYRSWKNSSRLDHPVVCSTDFYVHRANQGPCPWPEGSEALSWWGIGRFLNPSKIMKVCHSYLRWTHELHLWPVCHWVEHQLLKHQCLKSGVVSGSANKGWFSPIGNGYRSIVPMPKN